MTTINLNQPPYFDDFNENKKFYQILFRPGRAVQARELNQLQTLLKSQLDRLGKFVFDNGSVVYPIGSEEGAKYYNNIGFIKIPATAGLFTDTEANLNVYWLGKQIISTTGQTGITAEVIGIRPSDSSGEARLYLSYISGDTTGTELKFSSGQGIQTVETLPISITISTGVNPVGTISAVKLQKSIYFYNGRFVLVDDQTIFLTPSAANLENQAAWTNSPTASIGLEFIESVETWVEDESLLDNATGTPNIGAPGADRLRVAANLIQLDSVNDADLDAIASKRDYVEIFRIVSGDVKKRVTKTSLSDIGLEKQLATRTFEESGDYTVRPFQIQVKEFLRTATNNGANVEEIYQYDTPEGAKAASVELFDLPTPGLSSQHPTTLKYVPGNSYNTLGDSLSFISLCNARLTVTLDPGLAYVNGYRIEKISTEDVTLKKARDLKFRNNKFVSTPLGNYIYVKDVVGGVESSAYDTIDLYDAPIATTFPTPIFSAAGNKIGTARVLSLEYYSGWRSSASDSRVYRLFLFNVEMIGQNKFEQVKSIYSANPSFTCNVQLDTFRLTGSVTRFDDANDNLIDGAGTSWRNDESQRLKKGDFIQVNSGNSDSKIYRLFENPSSDNRLKIDTSYGGSHNGHTWPAGSKIDYLYALLRTDSTNAGLVYKLPDSPVATIRSAFTDGTINSTDSGVDVIYSIRQASAALTPSSGKITVNGIAGTKFGDFNPVSYSVVKLTGASGAAAGTWLQVIPYVSGSPVSGFAEVRPNFSNNLEIYLNATDATSATFKIHYDLVKLGNAASKEKIKTLIKGSLDSGVYTSGGSVTSDGEGWTVSTGADVNEISLKKPDVLRITRVVESPNYSTAPSSSKVLPSGHKDVTGLYILDNGQRDHYYDIAKVTLRPGYGRPRGQIRVEFDYFTHSGDGDYFSVNSYPFVGGTNPGQVMEYSDIPIFTASDGTTYDLASSFDFRPIVSSGGVNAAFSIAMGIPRDNVLCDYHFYLPRKDKLVLNSETKKFAIKYGKSDENPQFPSDPDKSMVIYELDVGAYTYSTSHVSAKMRENKRYTMRDIGKLETRISNLEYYTSLSLLEKDTNSLTVKDALGRDRFKNGFLVDNFKSFSACDPSSTDFKCTLDTVSGVVRPIIHEDPNPPKLFEKALMLNSDPNSSVISAQRLSKKYQKTGDLYTLPYTTSNFINQPLASKFKNVNPYGPPYAYVGRVEITPWTDEWRETSFAEPLNVKDEAAWQASRATFGPSGTKIDYTTTVNNWISVSSTTEGTGKQILQSAGHAIRERFFPNITKAKWNKMEFITVPEGYANAGQRVPIERRSWVSDETKTTTTQTGERITTNFTSSFVDQGFSAPISLGERIIDTALAEFIRSKTISFVGRAFKPKARVYPFFDGVNVSAYCTPTNGVLGAALISDGTGTVSGSFSIPDPKTSGVRFKTGDRIFRLTTSNINSLSPAPDSAGDARYSARGWVDTKQETTLSTRLFTIANGTTTSADPISQVLSTTFGETQAVPQDPLAQSFLIKEKGGCFITSIDIYFATRPDTSKSEVPPITLQLRPMSDDGYPTYKILPFGEVVKQASEVITNSFDVENGRLTITGLGGPWTNGEYSPSGTYVSGLSNTYSGNPRNQMVATRFTFKSPIYVSEGQYYSVVLIADSGDYNVWVAENGPDTDSIDIAKPSNVEIGTQTTIEKPVFLDGGLFQSENGINWVLMPKQDLKFRVNKAVFDTSVTGEIDYVNEELPLKQLTLDPLEFSNTTDISQTGSIRILHPNHGHTTARISPSLGNASRVVFSPIYNTNLTAITHDPTITTPYPTVNTNVTGNFNSISVGAYIKHPVTGEHRRVVAKPSANTLRIRTPFSSQITASMIVSVATVDGVDTYPTGAKLGGIHSDILFDYRGYEVQHTELDYYRIDVSKPRGTVSATNGNAVINGTNTQFTLDYVSGDSIVINNVEYTIASIATSVQLTLTTNYGGLTAAGLSLSVSGRFGGSKILVSENKRYEELTLLTTPLELPETEINWNIQTISSSGVNDSNTSTFVVQPRETLVPNERLIFDNPRLIGSYINELPVAGSPTTVGGPGYTSAVDLSGVGDRKSVQVRAVLRSNNPNLSPIIDESRMTAFIVANRLDDPKGISTTSNDSGQVINTIFDNYVCVPTTVSPTVTTTAGLLYFSSSFPVASGTSVTGVSGSRTLTGNGTSFLTEIRVGDTVTTATKETRKVSAVISNTELLVDSPLGAGFTGALYINPQNLKIKTANANIAKHLSNLDIGKYLTVSGSATSGARDFSDRLILAVNYTPNNTVGDTELSNNPKLIEIEVDYKLLVNSDAESNSVTLTQKDRFVDEVASNSGSCASKYVSKKLVVTRPSNALKVMFEGSRDETCNIDLYYKLELVNATTPFESVNWTKATFNTEVNGVYVDATPKPNLSNIDFTEYESTLGDLPAFTGAQVKIVMRGGNPARSVRIKNLRLLVLDD